MAQKSINLFNFTSLLIMLPITPQYSINLLNCSIKLILPTVTAHKSINIIYCSFYISQFNQTPCDLGIDHNSVLSRMWHQSVYLKPSITGHKSINLLNCSLKLILPTIAAHKSINLIYCSFYISQFNQTPCDLGIHHNSFINRRWHQSA